MVIQQIKYTEKKTIVYKIDSWMLFEYIEYPRYHITPFFWMSGEKWITDYDRKGTCLGTGSQRKRWLNLSIEDELKQTK